MSTANVAFCINFSVFLFFDIFVASRCLIVIVLGCNYALNCSCGKLLTIPIDNAFTLLPCIT